MARTRVTAHPRSRGENFEIDDLLASTGGSSPLTRGKHDRRRPDSAAGRLIPAHAGKTWSPMARSAWRTAHPRSRGENKRTDKGRFSEQAHPRSRGENGRFRRARAGRFGSSPLTRGKRPGRNHPPRVRRLIPAHAGKTGGCVHADGAARAHPRSRGENRPGNRGP